MSQPAELCLEELLRTWEDRCLEREAMLRLAALSRPDLATSSEGDMELLCMWRNYRHMLLDNSIERLKYEDWIFDVPSYFSRVLSKLDALSTFPLEFFAWTRKSRRVFSIPELEQEMFAATTMSEIRWGDILWPFKSFVIELAKGLTLRYLGEDAYVCTHILVSTMWYERDSKDGKIIHIRALNGGIPAPYHRNERKRLLEAIGKDDLVTMAEIGSQVLGRRQASLGQGALAFPLYMSNAEDEDDLVLLDEEGFRKRMEMGSSQLGMFLREIDEPMRKIIGDITRIVVGTCLYLESVAPSFPSVPDIRRRMGRKYIGPLGILTDEVDVCRIISRNTVDPSRYDLPQLEQIGQGFVKPHWRRRHRRRPAFTPVDHPKTIIVPPKLINASLVPLFGILAGSISRMLSAEEEFK